MPKTAPTSQELLKHFEDLTGRSFKSHEDVRSFIASTVAAKEAKHVRSRRRWNVAKHATLAVFLVLALLQYYSFDVLLQIISLRGVTVFVPVGHSARR